MNIKPEIIFFIIILFIILIGVIWMIKTEKRLKRLFLGKKGKDLEDTILNLEGEIEKLKKSKEENEKEVREINAKLKKSIRGLETIRFNPFPDQGSNQSFAIGMLNEDGDGVVFSSLYSRERMSIFAKPIKNGKSEYELTEEENEVVEKAKI
jgi:predicted Holliday junction resolvase-like endonuclease